MDLLVYFAFPIATIIISIVLQKIIKNPALVAAFTFAIFLIVTFTTYDESFLINTFIYTMLSLITAFIVDRFCINNNNNDNEENENDEFNLVNTNEKDSLYSKISPSQLFTCSRRRRF